jgi:hypothetical protein
MPPWGDVDKDDVVNFTDIGLAIMAFEGRWITRIPPYTLVGVDIVGSAPCRPNQIANFRDISFRIFAFEGEHYNPDVLCRFAECDAPCP